MTKTVRIENADNGDEFGLLVQAWRKTGEDMPDERVPELDRLLQDPTALATITLYGDMYLVVKPVKVDPPKFGQLNDQLVLPADKK